MTTARTAASPRRSAKQPPARPPSRSGRLSLPLLAALVIAALAIVAVFLGADGGTSDIAVQETAAVNVDGDALPPFQGPESDPAVGLQAPELRGASFEGAPLDLSPGEHPTVLLFATHWCGYCQDEVDALSPWLTAGGAGDVKVLVVSTGVDAAKPNHPPSEWFEREEWPGAVMVDSADSEAAQAFGLTGYPYFVFLDGDGRVVGRHSGSLGAEQLEEITEGLRG